MCFTLDSDRIQAGVQGGALFWDGDMLLGGSNFVATGIPPLTSRSSRRVASLEPQDQAAVLEGDALTNEAVQPFDFAMGCPSHEHGSVEEASRQVIEFDQNENNKPHPLPIAVHICRTSKERALPIFAPLADLVFFNPGTSTEFAQSSPGALEAMDRLMQHAVESASPQPVWAVIGCEPGQHDNLFSDRYPTARELETLVVRSLSLGAQGLLYRSSAASGSPIPSDLKILVRQLNEKTSAIRQLIQIACPEPFSDADPNKRFVVRVLQVGPDKRLVWVMNGIARTGDQTAFENPCAYP